MITVPHENPIGRGDQAILAVACAEFDSRGYDVRHISDNQYEIRDQGKPNGAGQGFTVAAFGFGKPVILYDSASSHGRDIAEEVAGSIYDTFNVVVAVQE